MSIICISLQSKALRERWLLDGAPAEEETQKRLQEEEVKTKLLEQVILRSASKNPYMYDFDTDCWECFKLQEGWNCILSFFKPQQYDCGAELFCHTR